MDTLRKKNESYLGGDLGQASQETQLKLNLGEATGKESAFLVAENCLGRGPGTGRSWGFRGTEAAGVAGRRLEIRVSTDRTLINCSHGSGSSPAASLPLPFPTSLGGISCQFSTKITILKITNNPKSAPIAWGTPTSLKRGKS